MTMLPMAIRERQKILGSNYGNCDGPCYGSGFIPIHRNETEDPYHLLWEQAEKELCSFEGWHWVKCPYCNGTGSNNTDP